MSSSPATDPIDDCLDFLSAMLELSETAVKFLREKLLVQNLIKGTVLLPAGRISAEFYFIHSGLLRSYALNEQGKDLTNWFVHEANIIFSPFNYRNQITAPDNVELLEESTLVSLTYDELEELYLLDPVARSIGQRLTERQLVYMTKRVDLLRSLNSEQRYLLFLELFPGLIGRVQIQHVATFLNISRGTASRILSGRINKN